MYSNTHLVRDIIRGAEPLAFYQLIQFRMATSDDSLECFIGYCFGDRETGEFTVLALLPEYEIKGIGKLLLNLVIKDVKALGFERLFLGCAHSIPKHGHMA